MSSINSNEIVEYGSNEWKKAKSKHKKRLKDSGVSQGKKFESDMWLLWNELEPKKVSTGPVFINSYEVDILLQYKECVICIECKSGKSHDVKKEIGYIRGDGKTNKNKILKKLNISSINVVYMAIYKNQELTSREFAMARKKGRIILWGPKHLVFYKNTINKLKAYGREIVFSDLLQGQKIYDFNYNNTVNVLALRGTFKSEDKEIECYNFLLSPELLKKISYVNRRHLQISNHDIGYQRLLNHNKVKKIRSFLEEGGNFFPTSILINFDQNIPVETKTSRSAELSQENVDTVWLKLPLKHGYCYVIDGQHRIYGYSGLENLSKEHFLNVMAFKNLSAREQAKIFVDINQNQKAIQKEILWDLYTSLYEEGDIEYEISRIIKNFNTKNSTLKDKIYIPSTSGNSKTSYGIYINNLASSIKKIKKIYKELCNEDFKKYEKILNEYINNLAEGVFSKDIENEKTFMVSNNGISVLLYVLNYFPKFIQKDYANIKDIPLTEIQQKLTFFSEMIGKAIDEIGINKLMKDIKDKSSEAGKKDITKDIIIKCGEFSENMKVLSNQLYLTTLEENMYTEFKETIYLGRDGSYNDQYFHEAILGTISAFINKGKNGTLYIGVTDDKAAKGIDKELVDKFGGKHDNAKKFLEDKIKDRLKTKNFNKGDIGIDTYIDDPFIIKVKVPESTQGIAFVKMKSGFQSWIKRSQSKFKLDHNNCKAELGEKVEVWRELYIELHESG